jgi:hypothetical protein
MQILSTRARKGVSLNTIKVQVCLFAFDLLYLNGHPLLQEQLNVRREVYFLVLGCGIFPGTSANLCSCFWSKFGFSIFQ